MLVAESLEVGVSGKGALDGLGAAVVNGSKESVGDVGLGVVVFGGRVGVAGNSALVVRFVGARRRNVSGLCVESARIHPRNVQRMSEDAKSHGW